jgi:hypothetical protein
MAFQCSRRSVPHRHRGEISDAFQTAFKTRATEGEMLYAIEATSTAEQPRRFGQQGRPS